MISKIFKYGGHIPKSIAIIMDGNRRYAEKNKLIKIKGHEDGLVKLLEIIEWSILLEINEITVFAFSIDNYNRPKEEFDNLMNLTKEKFVNLGDKGEYFEKNDIKICIYGNIDLLKDKDLVNKFCEIENKTKNNKRIKLNICFSYNSTEENLRSLNFLIKNIDEKENTIPKRNINNNYDFDYNYVSIEENKEIFERNLYGGYDCKPDILIRTSGEIRLSNFLLYQTRFSMLIFMEKLWPEISFYDYFLVLLKYNYNYKSHMKMLKEIEIINKLQINN
jgi:ditrans,polycis-polyprenyl diphosphate synthase